MRAAIGKSFFILPVALIWFVATASAQTLTEKLSAEDPAKIAAQARSDGNIVRGAILFHQGNINCAKCHRPQAGQARLGPDLSSMGDAVTDAHIIESILYPSRQIKEGYENYTVLTSEGLTFSGLKVSENDQQIVFQDSSGADKVITIERAEIEEMQPGKISSMPAALADELKSRQQFLDLLRYVFDLKERGSEQATITKQALARRELSPELSGLVLLQKHNCAACHQSPETLAPVAAKQPPRLAWSAQHLNPEYLAKFIADPHELKPGSTMPQLLGAMAAEQQTQAATALTHFLLRQARAANTEPAGSETTGEQTTIDGEAVHRGHEVFHAVGCVACHAPRSEQAIEQPLAGSIPLGDLTNKYTVTALTEFLADPLAVRPSGHMPNMVLTQRESIDLANYLLQSQADRQPFKTWSVEDKLAAEGQQLFTSLNCARCHTEIGSSLAATADKQGIEPASNAAALKTLNPQRGCLSEPSEHTGQWPNFNLSDADRKSMRAVLQKFPTNLSATEQIDVTLTSFNCTACHSRDQLGGISADRNPHFQTTNLNLGDQGRIPPTLTGVGAKLNPKWMRDVLVNRRSIRPYMKTRMPQFGEENIGHLLDLFESTDQLPQTTMATFEDQKVMREQGHLLAGDKGLNCVACHTYQYKISDTMPAVDLTEMTERLKKDWFYQYMLAPQSFSPNTVMPSFWPAGKPIRTDVEGSPEMQIEALWQYLIDGRQARAPSGVVRQPLVIAVADEARMLRRSYPGIGKRGIGVGYPGGINIAYDAEQMRLGAIWRGEFAEASGVWTGQGSGTVRALGRPIEFCKGPDVDDATAAWVVDDGRPPLHRFGGYQLDQLRRPTFMYQFDGVSVEDFFAQTVSEPARVEDESKIENETENESEERSKADSKASTSLRRTVTLAATEAREIRFRVANGVTISSVDGWHVVDKRLKIRVLSQHDVNVKTDDSGQQLEIEIELAAGEKIELVIEYLVE